MATISDLRDTAGPVGRILSGSLWLLWSAGLALLLGLVAFGGDGLVAHGIGYALSSVVTFSLVALFRRRSLHRMFTAGIAVSGPVNIMAICILLLGFAAAIAHAWFIARQVA